jgi:uncharacterized membrane protein (UPF0127 family)
VRRPAKISNLAIPIILVLIAAAVIAAVVIGGSEKPSKTQVNPLSMPCGQYRDDKQVKISGQTIKAEIPRGPNTKLQGLAGRPCILPDQGMLFVFSKPGQYFFWMKDMRFPIDIIWISSDHKVVGQEIGVEPKTYPDRFVNKKENPAQYVLELKAQRSRELNVTLGTPVDF